MQNHVWLEKRATSTSGLLTPVDERHKIRELLGDRFLHTGQLFHPDHTFFELSDDDQLQQTARQLLQWLGTKPGHLEIKYGDTKSLPGIYTEDPGMKRLIVHRKLSAHPLQCAAILTHLVMHFVISGRKRFVMEDAVENELFINQAVIESGLGLAVVNGLASAHFWHKVTLPKEADPSLYFPDTGLFIQNLAGYISNYRIHHEEYGHHLAPWIEDQLPKELKIRVTVRNAQPVYIRRFVDQRKRLVTKIVTGSLLCVLLAGSVTYAVTSGDDRISDDRRRQQQQLSALKSDYELCISSLQDKKRRLDHNDMFQQRIIEKETSRCTSLRNEYNSLADSYNKSFDD